MNLDFYLWMKFGGAAVFIFGGAAVVSRRLSVNYLKAVLVNSAALLTGFTVSRVWYIVQHVYGKDPYQRPASLLNEWSQAGSVLYGWILGTVVVLVFLAKIIKTDPVRTIDCVVPPALIAQFMNRLGCVDAGCCYGKKISQEFILRQRPELQQALTQLGRQPVQLYEGLFDLALFFLTLFKFKKRGEATFVYLAGYAIGRFFLEFLRGDNHPALFFMTVPQFTSILILITVFSLRKKILSR